MNLAQDKSDVNILILKDLGITLKIGLVEIKILIYLYNNHNLMLYIIVNFLNGYLLKNFNISFILQKVVLVKFIQLNDLKEIFECWNIKDQECCRYNERDKICIKILNNSSNISSDFLNEIILI